MRVAVTGAAGHVGSVIASRLGDRHTVRGADLRSPADIVGEFVVGDCADPVVAAAIAEGMDAVVHFAGHPTSLYLPTALHSHVETTAALLDAMVRAGVPRMVYASSNHAVGMTPRGARLGVDGALRPDSFYGVAKVAAEAMLQLYADRHGVSSVALRIGSFLERPETRRNLATWLSYDDCERLVEAALTAQFDGVRVVYGVSANTRGWWDLEPGRAIGYEPRDDAAAYADTMPARPDDDAEAAFVGGPFAIGTMARPFIETDEHNAEGGAV